MTNLAEGLNPKDAEVVTCLYNYKTEADSARRDRINQNTMNSDTYLLKQDWSHKSQGQSKEFLAKQSMAVEQIVSFAQQGLIDLGEWFSVDEQPGVENPVITAQDIERIMGSQLQKADFYTGLGDGLKNGLLNSLMIAKVHGRWVNKSTYTARDVVESKGEDFAKVKKLFRHTDKVWQLAINIIPFKDYYIDPTGRGLYEMHEFDIDLHELKAQVKSRSNPLGIYDKKVVDQIHGDMRALEEDARKARANGQVMAESGYRKQVRIRECWGTILSAEGEVLHENVVCAVVNDRYLVRAPQKNPFWHNTSPFVVAPIVRVPDSVVHKALMDAPTMYNKALNELFNLNLDCGMMAAHGIKQLRVDWLEDASQVANGIYPGQTLDVGTNCPPGQKVLERVDTASMSQESLAMLNITDKEFQVSALTNDLRMGVLPGRQVKATEVVESSQSITGMLNGIAKSIENDFIVKVLEKSWQVSCQHYEDFDAPEMMKLLGKDRALAIKALSRPERFAETVGSYAFRVYGITGTLNKSKDFRRITTFLQTIAGSEVLVEEFAKEYSFGKLLTEIMKALGIEEGKLKLSQPEKTVNAVQKSMLQAAAPAGQPPGQPVAGAGGPGAPPNRMSQVPSASSTNAGPVPGTVFAHGRANPSPNPSGQ